MSRQVLVFFIILSLIYKSVLGQPIVHSPMAVAHSQMASEPRSSRSTVHPQMISMSPVERPFENSPKIPEPIMKAPMIYGSSSSSSIPDCNSLVSELNPCISYIMRSENSPSNTCCAGVKTLKKYNNNKAARQAICQCLESMAPMLGQIDYSLLSGLPKTCGVSINLPADMSSTFDCSKA